MQFLDYIPDYLSDHCISGRIEPISSQFDRTDEYAASLSDEADRSISIFYFSDHVDAYHSWHHILANMREYRPVMLLHFDAHPDIKGEGYKPVTNIYGDDPNSRKRYAEDFLSLGNFIDAAIYDRLFESAAWILPEWAAEGSTMFPGYWNTAPMSYQSQYLYSGHDAFELCFTLKHQKIIGEKGFDLFNVCWCDKCGNSDGAVHQSFPIKKTYIDEMPDIADRAVILDIDMDWFCNTGWDTAEAIHSEFDCAAEAPGLIDSFIEALKEKGISPIGVTIAASPDYFPTAASSEALYLVVSGLIEAGIVKNPGIHSGKASYSANITYFARSLYNFIQHRIDNPDVADGEVFVCRMNNVDESAGYSHVGVSTRDYRKTMPGIASQSLGVIEFACAAGDYSQYIYMAREFGLLKLAGALEELQRGGSMSERDVLAILIPMMSNVPYDESQVE